MKCSQCYADNDAFATICRACRQPVLPLELCNAGHILPPGSNRCLSCQREWPQVPPYAGGPAVLRGVLLVQRGRLLDPATETSPEYLELRDSEAPFSILRRSEFDCEVASGETSEALAKVLVRPQGVFLCKRTDQPKLASVGERRYERLRHRQVVELESLRMLFLAFQPSTEFSNTPG